VDDAPRLHLLRWIRAIVVGFAHFWCVSSLSFPLSLSSNPFPLMLLPTFVPSLPNPFFRISVRILTSSLGILAARTPHPHFEQKEEHHPAPATISHCTPRTTGALSCALYCAQRRRYYIVLDAVPLSQAPAHTLTPSRATSRTCSMRRWCSCL
jgi:hypothetical protein